MPATKLLNKRVDYPMGSVSCDTMREEDLIPEFLYQLDYLASQRGIYNKRAPEKREMSPVSAKERKAHLGLVREIEGRIDTGTPGDADLSDLFDALGEYAGPYFYFGSHPGDGPDYGFWLSEDWDRDFVSANEWESADSIKVNDLADVPAKFRGEVAVVNDRGNVTLYRKTSRALHEVWSIVR